MTLGLSLPLNGSWLPDMHIPDPFLRAPAGAAQPSRAERQDVWGEHLESLISWRNTTRTRTGKPAFSALTEPLGCRVSERAMGSRGAPPRATPTALPRVQWHHSLSAANGIFPGPSGDTGARIPTHPRAIASSDPRADCERQRRGRKRDWQPAPLAPWRPDHQSPDACPRGPLPTRCDCPHLAT